MSQPLDSGHAFGSCEFSFKIEAGEESLSNY